MIATRNKPAIGLLLHSLTVGGAELLATRLAGQLRDRYRFVFICLDEVGELGGTLREAGFSVYGLGRRSGFDWRCGRRLLKLLRTERIDVIHAHQYTPFFYALMTRLFGGRFPVLFTEHGRFFPDYPRRKRIIFNRLLLRRRDRVVAVGEAVRRALIDNEGIPARRTEVIYNGIDSAAFALGGDRHMVRKELGLQGTDFVAIQVARLDYLKDHSTALRTAENLAARYKAFRLLLVGDGPQRAPIETEIQQRKVGEHVRLLGTRRDIPRLLSAADVCLLTSISEGIPLTLIEAMAGGLPVVATDVGGVREVVRNSQTGLLAPSGDDRQLAEYLLFLANHPSMRSEMGREGARRATELFSEARMCDEYAGRYDSFPSS